MHFLGSCRVLNFLRNLTAMKCSRYDRFGASKPIIAHLLSDSRGGVVPQTLALIFCGRLRIKEWTDDPTRLKAAYVPPVCTENRI
jgi:hypothetical protein